MAWLFKRGDTETETRILNELSTIIRAAFAGEATRAYEYLTRLAADEALPPNDPAFQFPQQRRAVVGDIDLRVTVALRPGSTSENRELQFYVSIKATDWSLNGSLLVQAAQEASSWISIRPPSGYCSDRTIALPKLTEVCQMSLSFAPFA